MRPSLQWARRTSTTYSRSASEARISGVWPPNPSRLISRTVSHFSGAVDGSFRVPQPRGVDPRALGDDLGADGHRRLLRRAGAEVEPDRGEDAGQLLVGHALVTQALLALLRRPPAPHRPEVADLGPQRRLDGGHVELVVVGEDAHGVTRTERLPDTLEQAVRPVDDDLVRQREPLRG